MLSFINQIKPRIDDVLRKEVLELGPIKFAIAVMVKLKKEAEYTSPVFRTGQIVLLSEHEIAKA